MTSQGFHEPKNTGLPPPKDIGDFAFIQHMIASLNADGMMGVVVPHGVLFRGASEMEIRKGILDNDLLEAVIGLPPKLFYGTGIPAAMLIINKNIYIIIRIILINCPRDTKSINNITN